MCDQLFVLSASPLMFHCFTHRHSKVLLHLYLQASSTSGAPLLQAAGVRMEPQLPVHNTTWRISHMCSFCTLQTVNMEETRFITGRILISRMVQCYDTKLRTHFIKHYGQTTIYHNTILTTRFNSRCRKWLNRDDLQWIMGCLLPSL